jgi:putative phosphotransacetylase
MNLLKNIMKIPVEVSARHIHISKKDLETLFGEGYQLHKLKQLTQPSDFATEEVLDIEIGDKKLLGVRIVGPEREKTQIEISKTDAVLLGVNPPVRLSGDLENSLALKLIGPKGELELSEGLIIVKRHIHCATSEAENLGLKNNDVVSVKVESERPIIFEGVVVRINDDYKLSMHIDTDEGNAAGINKIGQGEIL